MFLAILVLNCVVFSIYLFTREAPLTESLGLYTEDLNNTLKGIFNGYGFGKDTKEKVPPTNQQVLLPASFTFEHDALNRHLQSTSAKGWRVEQLNSADTLEVPPIHHGSFSSSEKVNLFNGMKEVSQDQCFLEIGETVRIHRDQIDEIPWDMKNILRIYLEELDHYNDAYNEDIAPILAEHVRVELENDVIDPYWFRLSGSSVWLKEYNVHLVVSRLIFSHQRNKLKSDASLALAQIFDKDWNELNDVRLVFPTNVIKSADSPTFQSDGQDFYSYRFPRMMPIPFLHEYQKKGPIFRGPEDPRVFLVQNPKGYEEPIIVFNAFQKRYWTNYMGEQEAKASRNMFMSFLFQLQKGKNDLEPNLKADNKYFTRTKELIAAGTGRTEKEKNWTPLVSENQEAVGLNRYVYFATQISDLRIIKCDIYSDYDECEVEYNATASVGALRGGTPFVNINQLLRKQPKYNIHKLIPEGREIWVGVARAHFKQCGCGVSFYRPNIVVLIKDEATYFDKEINKIVTKSFWRLSHVSSFFGLGVEIIPWRPEDPRSICLATNALIPNGIGTWTIEEIDHKHGKWHVDDVLTLFFSISDSTVDKINIKGLLNSLMNTRDDSIFMNVPSAPRIKELNQPILTSNGELEKPLPKFTNTNIECALEESKHFCKAYGDEQKSKLASVKASGNNQATKQLEKDLLAMENSLRKIGF